MAGLATMVQLVPFQERVRDCVAVPSKWEPTAMHFVGVTHETSYRLLDRAALLLGLGTMAHAVPFHEAVRVWSNPPCAR